MNRQKYIIAIFIILFSLSIGIQAQDNDMSEMENEIIYIIEAENARLVRNVQGEMVADVQGVIAQPVDSFSWDGTGVEAIDATARIEINPITNEGTVTAEWSDRNGNWTLSQQMFVAPPHPTGLRISDSANDTVNTGDDPVVTNVYLHGDTGAAEPVLPTLFNLLATWGPAEVTLNGETFENPYDGPAPLWFAHSMTTVGVRNPDGTVTSANGEVYNPQNADIGATTSDDMEFHLTWHDAPGPEVEGNFPPMLSFFYHLSFEDVSVEIQHIGGADNRN